MCTERMKSELLLLLLLYVCRVFFFFFFFFFLFLFYLGVVQKGLTELVNNKLLSLSLFLQLTS